jgi:hypothetical protein
VLSWGRVVEGGVILPLSSPSGAFGDVMGVSVGWLVGGAFLPSSVIVASFSMLLILGSGVLMVVAKKIQEVVADILGKEKLIKREKRKRKKARKTKTKKSAKMEFPI